ncbi:MAG: NAD(P)/FAD-dependent oxidoreductase [Sporichthyaceae bacterium]
MTETVDVVIVGSRCAGSAAAIALARRGRSVIALDSASFPSDTLSTHLFFPHHWAEIERLGALPRVLALKAPMHTRAGVGTPQVELMGPYSNYEGFAAGSCVKRAGLDFALVETAREAGAEVREHRKVVGLLRDGAGRATGVRWQGGDGTSGEIAAKLVIGADGRDSAVARMVGTRAHHEWPNQRMMAYAYYSEGRPELADLAMQWRQGSELVTVFPCDGDQSLVLLMPPVSRARDFQGRVVEGFEETVASIPQLQARLAGCERQTKPRVSYQHPSYFRHSHGPGWALAGDAGHFKDPVTAQGIRDALRFGRTLGEAAAPALDDPAALDAALAAWELDRDDQCLPMYQWANGLGRDDAVSPIEAAAYGWFAGRPGGVTEILDVFSRRRRPDRVFTPVRFAKWATIALRAPGADRTIARRTVARDLGRETARLKEAATFKRRRAASAAAGFVPRD